MAQAPTNSVTQEGVLGQVSVTFELRAVKPDGSVFSHTSQDWGSMSEESFNNVEKAIAGALFALGDERIRLKKSGGNKA